VLKATAECCAEDIDIISLMFIQ